LKYMKVSVIRPDNDGGLKNYLHKENHISAHLIKADSHS